MKKVYIISLMALSLLLFVQQSAFSQKTKFKFGNVTASDFNQPSLQDSTAGAIVLFDVGKSYFTFASDLQLVFEHHKRIKILSKSGYDWANAEIELYSSTGKDESLSKFEASTYNLVDGKVVVTDLKKDGIFHNKVIDNYAIKKFTLPNVKEGSIIEFKYKVYSPYLFNIRPWSFQESIPVKYSEYSVDLPDFLLFKKQMKGFEPVNFDVKRQNLHIFTTQSSAGETMLMTAENMPAFKTEAFITSADNYKTAIEFEISSITIPGQSPIHLLKDWPQIGRELIEHEYFGDILNKKSQVKESVEAIIKDQQTAQAKMVAIYDHVRTNYKWNDYAQILASQRLKKTLDDKSGNVADINLLLTLMLKAGGLSAHPVILSTRSHGYVLPYFAPMLNKFNYVICQVKIKGKTFLLDATDTWRPYNVLPERCINGQGRVMYEDASDWVDLKNQENIFHYTVMQLELTDQGELEGAVSCSKNSYAAFTARNRASKKPKAEYIEDEKKIRDNWEVKDFQVENLDNAAAIFVEKYEVKIHNMANKAGDKIYLEPMLIERIEENPFKMNDRKYPVDFAFPIKKTYTCTIKLPKGYTLEEPVKPIIVSLPENSGRFSYEIKESAGCLHIQSNLSLNKAIFLPEEYSNLKEFYNYIINKQAEQVVLKKI